MVRAATWTIALSLASLASAQAQTPGNWWDSRPLKGWVALFTPTDTYVMVQSAQSPPSSSYRRIWVRYEFREPMSAGLFAPSGSALHPLSEVDLEEYDCAQLRSRTLQAIYYGGPNMEGEHSFVVPGADAPWTYTAPGTIANNIEAVACQNAPPRTR